MVGALSAGPIGDRVGRKPLLVANLTIIGLASLLSASAGSLFVLSIFDHETRVRPICEQDDGSKQPMPWAPPTTLLHRKIA
jgi:MFS family permease